MQNYLRNSAGRKDADRFKINSTTGELSFDFSSGFFLNFENPVDHNQDRIFEVEIEAIKLVGTETFNSEPFLLKVRIENAPEAPEFKPLTNAFPDANFSIVEQNRSKTFTGRHYPRIRVFRSQKYLSQAIKVITITNIFNLYHLTQTIL